MPLVVQLIARERELLVEATHAAQHEGAVHLKRTLFRDAVEALVA